MEEDPQFTSGPISGGLIRLQAYLADPATWLSPIWAVLCGVVASGDFGWQAEDWLRLGLLILLVDGGWGTLWAALASTDWTTPLRHWRSWRSGKPVVTPPYTLPGSPGDQASHWLGQLRAWWRYVLWPDCGPALSAIVVALPVTVLLGALLGPDLLMLSAAALAVMQLGLVGGTGQRTIQPEWSACIAVALPWLAGHATSGSLTPSSTGLALAFTLGWGTAWRAGSRLGCALATGAQLLAAALLVALNRPLAAGCLLLLLVPQLALLPWLQRGLHTSWYVQHTRPWLMAAMLVAAWAL